MFTRTAVAALMLAAVPMMGVSTAEAAKGKTTGHKGHVYQKYQKTKAGKKTVVKKQYTTKNKRYVVTTKKSTIKTKNGYKTNKVVVRHDRKPSYGKKFKKHFNHYYVGTGKYLKNFYYGYNWKRSKNYKCVVGAKRRGGNGPRLWNIGGKKYGPGACKRAMNECHYELRRHKARGHNPYAKCVIVHRG